MLDICILCQCLGDIHTNGIWKLRFNNKILFAAASSSRQYGRIVGTQLFEDKAHIARCDRRDTVILVIIFVFITVTLGTLTVFFIIIIVVLVTIDTIDETLWMILIAELFVVASSFSRQVKRMYASTVVCVCVKGDRKRGALSLYCTC
jgi:hypothetical protein